MLNADRKWKRRHYFINKDLQGKYAFYFFVIVTLGCILFTLIFGLLVQDTLTIVYKDSRLQFGSTPAILIKEILKADWIYILLGGIIVPVLAIFLTHRFAGPIYRFERSLDEMMRGNLNFEIVLRKRDSGKELAKMINAFNSILSERIVKVKELSELISANLSTLARSSSGENKEINKAFGAIRSSSAQIKDILGAFTVKDKTKHVSVMGHPTLPVAELASSESDKNFITILIQLKELTNDLEEALDSPGLIHLTNEIDAHLSKFAQTMPADNRKILEEIAAIIRQTKDMEARLKEAVNSSEKIIQ